MKKNSPHLPIHANGPKHGKHAWHWALLVFILPMLYLLHRFEPAADGSCTWKHVLSKPQNMFSIFGEESNPDSLCPMVEKLDPSPYLYNAGTLQRILHDVTFKKESLEKLQKAVQEPTQVYDGMVVPKGIENPQDLLKFDERWGPFESFHGYLEDTFPLIHKHLKLEKINKLGLVYTWQGSDESKKPIMLTAHYDVVPVQPETVGQWTYPPFKAHFDGEYVYGRGTVDCKDLLVALLESVELLLSEGEFSPQRTIILAFGYDEEAGGEGAFEIGKFLLARYGPSSMYQIIDEGNGGIIELEGDKYIMPATGEKGHLNSILELFTPGGHSSVPPKHTAIGLLSKVISLIEDEEFESVLSNANPILNSFQCVAENSKTIDPELKKVIMKAHLDKQANDKFLQYLSNNSLTKFTVKTSQAVDVISGGVKSNALPEHASVLINHRIAVEESVESTRAKVLRQVQSFALEYDLGLVCDGKIIMDKTKNGYFNYTTNEPLEPAPVTPTGDQLWNTYGGSLRYLFEDLLYPDSNDTYIFAPLVSIGNTDTKSYWELTRSIFRYVPGNAGPEVNAHSVDEKLLFEGHLQNIAFYYYYLQVVDQLEDPEQ